MKAVYTCMYVTLTLVTAQNKAQKAWESIKKPKTPAVKNSKGLRTPGGAFHQAFCQWFSLTNFISYWNPCIWLAESKLVSENHWQKAWWNAPQMCMHPHNFLCPTPPPPLMKILDLLGLHDLETSVLSFNVTYNVHVHVVLHKSNAHSKNRLV